VWKYLCISTLTRHHWLCLENVEWLCVLGVDGGVDIKQSLLVGIYKRISRVQLQPDHDHTSKLIAVDNSIAGLKLVPAYLLTLYVSYQSSTVHFSNWLASWLWKIIFIFKILLLVILS